MAVAVRERVADYSSPPRPTLGPLELASLCRHVEERLLRGEERIRAEREAGRDVRDLERHWRELLRAYEGLAALRARMRGQI